MFRFGSLFKVAFLSTGRRVFALRKVQRVARDRGDTAIVARAQHALDHDHKTRKLDLVWSGQRKRGVGTHMQVVDSFLDQALASLRNGAQSAIQGARPGDPLIAVSDDFLARVFPDGLKAVTQLPYVEQLAAAEVIVELLQDDLAGSVTELGLDLHARRVIEYTAEYRVVQEHEPNELIYAEVREAREVGHELMLGVVSLVLSTYFQPRDKAHANARAELLAPIIEQDEIVRATRRARRRLVDVNPETGELDESVDVDDTPESADESVETA